MAKHRIARIVLFSVGGIFAALVTTLVLVGLFYDLGDLIDTQLQAQAPQISEKLGRKLHFGKAHLKLLPTVRFEVRDITVDPAPAQTGLLAQPLLTLGSLRARVGLLSLIFSLGKKVEIVSAEINELQVQVVRTADGHLSYQDILDKAATQPESPPMSQAEIDRLAGIVLHRAALNDAAIHFYDLSLPGGAGAPIKLDGIQLVLEEAQLFAPFSMTLDMAAMAPLKNFHFALVVGPLPRDLQVTQPLSILRRAELSLQPIEIEPLLRFLPPSSGLGLGRARVEAELKLETPAHAGQLRLSAKLGAKGAVLQQGTAQPVAASRRGQPIDLGLDTQVAIDLLAGNVQVEKLALSLGEMGVSGEADLRTLWTAPAINKLALSSHGLLLERFLNTLPPVAVPRGALLHGPLSLRGSASGTPTAAAVELALDLTPATILLPELSKPAGTALSLELRGQLKGAAGADIEKLGLTLGPLALLLRGQIRGADDIDLHADSSVDLDKLLRLLPTVERSLSKKGKVDGDFKVSATIQKKQTTLDLGARVTMANAQLDSGDIDLRGGADLSAKLHSTPQSASVNADLDLTGAQLRVPGSVDKRSGVPMRLRAQIERSGEVINVHLAELSLPGGTVSVVGRVDSGHNQLDLKIPPTELDLSRLSQVLPALSRGSLGGLLDSKLKIGVSFDGNPNKLGSARASLDKLEMTVGGGTVRGSAEVVGLDQPRKVVFNFTADQLDLDRIFPKSAEPAHADEEHVDHGGGSVDIPPFVRRLDLNGRIQVDSGRYRGAAVRDLLFEITMSGGKMLIKSLRGQALGGSINANGSTVDFGPLKPRFSLHAKLDKIDVGEVMTLRGGDPSKTLNGHGSFDLSADGQGLAWADIAPRVTGLLGLAFTDAKLETGSLGGQVVGPLVQQVGKKFAPSVAQQKMALRDLQAQFRIDNGKLHTTSPIVMHSDEGGLSLSGSIGLDKSLALTGNLDLAPAAISAASGGKLVPDGPIQVALRIGGTLSKPEIALADPLRTGAALLAAVLRGRGKEFLSGGGAGGVGGGALRNLLNGGAAGANQPATTPGAPGAPPTAAQPQPTPQENLQQRLQDAQKKGLGGLFGR